MAWDNSTLDLSSSTLRLAMASGIPSASASFSAASAWRTRKSSGASRAVFCLISRSVRPGLLLERAVVFFEPALFLQHYLCVPFRALVDIIRLLLRLQFFLNPS